MARAWLNRIWQLGVASFLIAGSAIPLSENYVYAQIQPDSTLGSETSVVNPVNENIDRIEGGAIRNSNLFHSFQDFNVDVGKAVYFANPQAIENIFSRVTGNNPSQIQGILGVLGKANLFLLNPNGIIFGENASLNVQGSFTATTADRIEFGDRGNFSAVNPETPQLLTINPSAFSFDRVPAGAIVNRSRAADPTGTFAVGLSLQPGKTLSLIGGNISLDGGLITAPGGRIELGGLSAIETIDMNSDGSLSFPENVERGNVSLSKGAGVSVRSGGGGAIAINSKNLELKEGSALFAGIAAGLGSLEAQAGDIIINVTDRVIFDGIGQDVIPSGINNAISNQGVGNTGNIKITTSELFLTNGGSIISSVFGTGRTGDIVINARNKVIFDGRPSGINNYVFNRGVGNTGNIKITTSELSLTNGGILLARLFGEGKTGDITINASSNIFLDSNTNIGNQIVSTGNGSTGNINISARNLSLTNGANILSFNQGKGVSGNIAIATSDTLSIDGSWEQSFSRINSYVGNPEGTGVGNAGGIKIDTKNLIITNGGTLGSFVFGNGSSGDITINASDNIFVDGEAKSNNRINSNINTFVAKGGNGNSGNININSKNLLITNGANIGANIFGKGNAGNISIASAERIDIDGKNTSDLASGISSRVGINATGNGGKIEISAIDLNLSNGANIGSASAGKGNAGNIIIEAKEVDLDREAIIDSGVFNIAEGNAGEIDIKANQISFNNGSQLNTQSSGKGNAGNITLNADSITLNNSSIFASNTPSADISSTLSGGNITLQIADRLTLSNNSDISTEASGNANGGNIDITADAAIAFDDSDIFAFAQAGRGGNITLNTPAYFGYNFNPASAQIKPDSSNNSLNGNDRADINATGAISGIVTVPDVSFIENSLTELPENTIDTNTLIANSCITRSDRRSGTFTVTGAGGLPNRPGDAAVSPYPTGDVRSVENDRTSNDSNRRAWKIGDPIVEPQAIYRLADGQMVLSRECER